MHLLFQQSKASIDKNSSFKSINNKSMKKLAVLVDISSIYGIRALWSKENHVFKGFKLIWISKWCVLLWNIILLNGCIKDMEISVFIYNISYIFGLFNLVLTFNSGKIKVNLRLPDALNSFKKLWSVFNKFFNRFYHLRVILFYFFSLITLVLF